MRSLIVDSRYALREFGRRPGFTGLAVLTMALGVGSVTTIYSVVHNVLLDPFPYTDSGRLVDVLVRDTERPQRGGKGAFPPSEFLDYQDESDVFEDVAGTVVEEMLYTPREGAARWQVALVTPNSFASWGSNP